VVTYDQLDRQGKPYEQNGMVTAIVDRKKRGHWLQLNSLPRPLRIAPAAFTSIVAWLGSQRVQLFEETGMPGWLRVQRQDGIQG